MSPSWSCLSTSDARHVPGKTILAFLSPSKSGWFSLKLMRNGILKLLVKNTADFVFLHLHSYCSSILNSTFSRSLLTSPILGTKALDLPPFTLSALHSSDTTTIKGKAELRLCGESLTLSVFYGVK